MTVIFPQELQASQSAWHSKDLCITMQKKFIANWEQYLVH